jgi:hypothetical protein
VSYSVLVFNFGDAPPPPFEHVQDSDLRPLGSAADVQQRISTLLPSVAWYNPTYGIYGADRCTIEFLVDANDPIRWLHLLIRGDAFSAIKAFTRPNGWTAWDDPMGEYIDPETARAG